MKRLALALLFLCFGTLVADAASRFGVCTTTCTWDGSSTAMWSASSGGATGASVPSSSDTVTFDAATCVGGTTCTITVNTNPTIRSLTMGACTASTAGCVLDFSVNNNNLSLVTSILGSFSVTGTGTRTLKLGSGTFTFNADSTGAGLTNTWDASVVTNLTFVAGTSTILYTGTSAGTTNATNSRSFIGGGLTYATVTFAADVGTGITEITDGGNTFTTLNIAGPNSVFFKFNGTQTITNPITWAGSSSAWIYITNNAQSALFPVTLAQGASNPTVSWVGFYGVTMTGGGTRTANNSLDFGANTGFTINPPASIANSGSGSACILGGWLLWRDMPEHMNDNFLAWLEKAA